MNSNLTNDDDRFDLLADGELDEAQRRELLSRLDDEPEGWRRCAMAFLEAQTWRETLGPVAAETIPSATPADSPAAQRRSWWSDPKGPAGTVFAMVASFSAALLLGWYVQGLRQPGLAIGRPAANQFVRQEVAPVSVPQRGTPATRLASTSRPDAASPKVLFVELPGGTDLEGQPQTVRLRAVERQQISRDWVEGLPDPISADLLRELEQAGLRVEQQRGLLPLKMQDGRALVVPVNDVNIRFVGKPTL